MTRRDLLEILIGMPAMLGGCSGSPSDKLTNLEEGRLHARPDAQERSSLQLPTGSSGKPQPLGFGGTRDGAIYVPSSYRASAPLLVYLHGAGDSGKRAIEYVTGHADRTGSIVLAPDSRAATWGIVSGDEEQDLAFIDDALEAAFATYSIDPRRVGIAGFSDGASAALSFGLVNGDLFSAIAAFSPGFLHTSGPARGTPRVFISHGSADQILPVERCGRRIASALRAAGYKVEYREFDGKHTVPQEIGRAGLDWLVRTS